MNIVIKLLLLLTFTILLNSCEGIKNPDLIQDQLNKPIPSKVDLFIVETHNKLGLSAFTGPVAELGYPGQLFPSSKEHIPSVSTYLQNSEPWEKWKKRGLKSRRIVGLAPKGTLIMIENYRIPSYVEETITKSTAEIIIYSGEFRGKRFKINSEEMMDILGIRPVEKWDMI